MLISNFRKKIISGFTVFLITFIFTSQIFASASHPPSPKKIIGITQILAHDSLDKVRQGTLDALKEKGYKKDSATILVENAYGNIATAAQIAQKFVGNHADVIIAIATPSAQTAIKAARDTHTPIVFASVTDPLKAKLVSNLKHPGQNVTGTRNTPMVDKQIDLLRQAFPRLKSLGIVLNYGEDNSVQLLEAINAYCKPLGIRVETAAANTSAEVQTATQNLAGKIDVLFLLQDNTIAAALPAVLKVAFDNKIPVFASYIEAVKAGALLGLAYDEYGIGYQTGVIAVRILNGTRPGDIAVENPDKTILAVNQSTAKQLGITFKPELLKKASLVFD